MMMVMVIVFSVPSIVGFKHPGTGHKSSLVGTALKNWIKTGTIEKRMKTRQLEKLTNK